jgi:Polyketide cyclase / dehydrase and lipid transport
MPVITGEIVIHRPIEVVFDFVADERNEPLYNAALLSSDKVTDGPVGVGTRFHATHKSSRRPVEMEVEITTHDRPNRVASRTSMAWSEIEGELVFESEGDATRMRWAWDVRPKGIFNLLRPLVAAIGRRSENECWTGLKRYLESLEPAE